MIVLEKVGYLCDITQSSDGQMQPVIAWWLIEPAITGLLQGERLRKTGSAQVTTVFVDLSSPLTHWVTRIRPNHTDVKKTVPLNALLS